MVLDAGSYIVVPRTTGCNLRRPDDAEAEALRLMDSQGNFHPIFSSTINDIFNKFDLVGAGKVEFKEWKGMIEIIEGNAKYKEEEFKNEVLGKYNSHENTGITLRGFRQWWKQ